jgi:hypothetical protein
MEYALSDGAVRVLSSTIATPKDLTPDSQVA